MSAARARATHRLRPTSRAVGPVLLLLALAAGCGDGPLYYDPYNDPWGGTNPWDPCSVDPTCYGYDPTGGYGYDPSMGGFLTTPGAVAACAPGDGGCRARALGAEVDHAMRLAAATARSAMSSAPASRGDGSTLAFGPVPMAGSTPGDGARPAARLTLTPAGSVTGWRLELKPPGAPDASFRTVFEGSTREGAGARTGSVTLDLDALAAAVPATGGAGLLTGTFSRDGRTDQVVLRLTGVDSPAVIEATASGGSVTTSLRATDITGAVAAAP